MCGARSTVEGRGRRDTIRNCAPILATFFLYSALLQASPEMCPGDQVPEADGRGSFVCVAQSELGVAAGGSTPPADLIPAKDEVGLSLWTNLDFPDGLVLGWANGISFGDYDRDGYIDIFAHQSGYLWRNVDGLTWELVDDLDAVLSASEHRYGSSFGDYNNDGLPDIATAPRVYNGDYFFFHLLKNTGDDTLFIDIAADPSIVDVQPYGNHETLCWGDVNVDGNLDLFVPVYKAFGGPGNFFLFNLGPTGPDGEYRFREMSAQAGLDNPPNTTRPEGAQFADIDFDGDMDLYSNGVIYRNVSTADRPEFQAQRVGISGIGLSDELDEGAMLFDYDLDGDYDVIVAYAFEGVRIWEARGDGTFFAAENVVESPLSGLVLGMSAEDWDLDGDIDFTTREVFRRNRLIEDGEKGFSVAAHDIAEEHLINATPAWGDWDRDGDLDCALASWGQRDAHLYENTLYGPDTPQADRRYVRVRPLGNSPTVEVGLENQYAASVDIFLQNGRDGFRRRKFVASGHGYLNQNEYALTFGLPQDPTPEDPQEGLRFDISVDFPSLPANGLWRVDKHVNPVLGNIDLSDLDEREVQVYRCGQVLLDGVLYEPPPIASPALATTTAGLVLSAPLAPLTNPLPAPADSFVGLSFNTMDATDSIRVTEVILDGELDDPVACGGEPANITFWDVTDGDSPFVVPGGMLAETTAAGNHRSYFRTAVVLAPQRSYRVVARVKSHRATVISAPIDNGPLEILGGLLYEDATSCEGQRLVTAQELPDQVFLALRFNAAGLASERPDPLAGDLTLQKEVGGPTLHWPMIPGVAGYEILRCDATSAACVPAEYATASENRFADEDPAANVIWYKVNAVRDCSSVFPRTPDPN